MAETKCKVCDHPFPLTETFCPECGFERHVFPALISKEVEEYEKKRVEEYKGRWEQTQEQNKEIEKLNSDLQTANDKSVADKQELKKLRTNLEEATHQASAIVKEKERQLLESSKKNEELKRQISQLESATKVVEAQRKDLVEKLTKANDSLSKEIEDHKKTKTVLEELKSHKTTTIIDPERPQPQQATQPNTQRTVIGKVMFTSGGRTESVELYSGLCRVTAPQWTNMRGELFEINGSNGLYRLFDIKGNICDRHGKPIPPQGTTTRNNDVFTSGNVTIRFTLPEIDYDSLY